MENNGKELVNVESDIDEEILMSKRHVDICFSVFCFIISVGFSIFLVYLLFSSVHFDEKDCVKFYKENHYVLDVCDKYKDKLEKGV